MWFSWGLWCDVGLVLFALQVTKGRQIVPTLVLLTGGLLPRNAIPGIPGVWRVAWYCHCQHPANTGSKLSASIPSKTDAKLRWWMHQDQRKIPPMCGTFFPDTPTICRLVCWQGYQQYLYPTGKGYEDCSHPAKLLQSRDRA